MTDVRFQGHVDTGGLSTYFEVEGTGEPLVLLHGGLFPIETIGGLSTRLADQFQVYLPERRGHGRTPDVEGPITYDLMAQDTIAFLEAVGLQRSDLVGWSDGALVGMLVALRRPDLVRRLVMIGTQVNPDGLRDEAKAVHELDEMPGFIQDAARELYVALSPDGPEHWPVVVAKIWKMWCSEPRIKIEELALLNVPTLLILGEHDFPTVEHGEAMARAIPNARLEVVPGATHGLPMDEPELVSRLVFDFLAV